MDFCKRRTKRVNIGKGAVFKVVCGVQRVGRRSFRTITGFRVRVSRVSFKRGTVASLRFRYGGLTGTGSQHKVVIVRSARSNGVIN